jgi:hypothetical protein
LVRDLIQRMTKTEPRERITTTIILKDPYFWPPLKILGFLSDVSNRLERKDDVMKALLSQLKVGSSSVVRDNWINQIDQVVKKELLSSKRSYNGTSVRDLLRGIRNMVRRSSRNFKEPNLI